jgi:D-3-phosphoglycerate dehydrogenase / 2-oxoglutarate reductase
MFSILTLNQISVSGLNRFPRDGYELASSISAPDAILLRSHQLTEGDIAPSTLAIARAGAGVNNIPVKACTARGVPVFNTPGANANAVKELVLAGMLLGSRGISEGVGYVRGLVDHTDNSALSKLLEKEKKQFKGNEIKGKTLGVVGLGAIGSLVAEMGLMLGMEVVGYDPALSVEAAWRLPREVKRMENLATLMGKSDYISLHLPALESTRHMINRDALAGVKKGAILLNFAREEIVELSALIAALDEGRLGRYIADFPVVELIARNDCVLTPHIGASTDEAEDNCAIMAADQLRDFLENGNIRNAVNFPSVALERTKGYRLAIANKNVPKILGNILSIFADANVNVIDMINKSRDDVAYNLMDVELSPSEDILRKIRAVDGVVNVRVIA